jgi:hypothetical protein
MLCVLKTLNAPPLAQAEPAVCASSSSFSASTSHTNFLMVANGARKVPAGRLLSSFGEKIHLQTHRARAAYANLLPQRVMNFLKKHSLIVTLDEKFHILSHSIKKNSRQLKKYVL